MIQGEKWDEKNKGYEKFKSGDFSGAVKHYSFHSGEETSSSFTSLLMKGHSESFEVINEDSHGKAVDVYEKAFGGHYTENDKYVSKAVFEPIVVDECCSGSCRQFYTQDDGSNKYSGRYYSSVDLVLDPIGKLTDQCTGLQEFTAFHSGEGISSSFTSLLMKDHSELFEIIPDEDSFEIIQERVGTVIGRR